MKTRIRIPVTIGGVPAHAEVVRWMLWAERAGFDVDLHETNSGIAAARNAMCAEFLADDDAEYLWMVDADVVPPRAPMTGPQAVLSGVYEAIYEARPGVAELGYSIWREQGDGYAPLEHPLPRKVFEADAVSAGCLRLNKDVLRAVPEPWFEDEMDDGYRLTLGEDFTFCRKVRNAGRIVWVDPSVRAHHMKHASLAVVREAAIKGVVRRGRIAA